MHALSFRPCTKLGSLIAHKPHRQSFNAPTALPLGPRGRNFSAADVGGRQHTSPAALVELELGWEVVFAAQRSRPRHPGRRSVDVILLDLGNRISGSGAGRILHMHFRTRRLCSRRIWSQRRVWGSAERAVNHFPRDLLVRRPQPSSTPSAPPASILQQQPWPGWTTSSSSSPCRTIAQSSRCRQLTDGASRPGCATARPPRELGSLWRVLAQRRDRSDLEVSSDLRADESAKS